MSVSDAFAPRLRPRPDAVRRFRSATGARVTPVDLSRRGFSSPAPFSHVRPGRRSGYLSRVVMHLLDQVVTGLAGRVPAVDGLATGGFFGPRLFRGRLLYPQAPGELSTVGGGSRLR